MRHFAFYLPQFHPVPENDAAWGKGFTEWTNVAKARPLFRGHYQPHLPAELGFYDLRVPETRHAQATLALAHGIDGFVYYHYWFHGRQVLERPFEEVLRGAEPSHPFCLCWANEPWTRKWDGESRDTILKQEYSPADDLAHIRALLPAFADDRYIRIDGKPLFVVYKARSLPDPKRTTDTWRSECSRNGLPEPYLCRVERLREDRTDPLLLGFDAAIEFTPDIDLGTPLHRRLPTRAIRRVLRPQSPYRWFNIYDYQTAVTHELLKPAPTYRRYPCVFPGWDNSPRVSRGGIIMRDAQPETYASYVETITRRTGDLLGDAACVFVNAWNEWAEGCHLEPDVRWGRALLEAHRDGRRRGEAGLTAASS